jgi:TIR domain-containing protein
LTAIFLSHAQENVVCAEKIHKDLESKGYIVRREPETLELDSILHPRTIENVILGSAAVILLWSSSAARSEWVEKHILTAQSLKKLILPVSIDETSLPNTLVAVSPITSKAPCTDIVAQLPQDFPLPDSTDPLIILSEQAAHDYIRLRKEAIDHAAEMLKRGEHREAVLAILEYLAQNDLMIGVRDKAQEALDADAKKDAPSPIRPDESRHIFGVRCKNEHVSYFDKRRVCSAYKEVPRDIRQSAGQELDELHLTCDQCGVEVVARVDCRGYK